MSSSFAQTATAATTTSIHCFRCQYHPGPDDTPLQRCGRCRARHYCSRDCQTADRPTHKNECRILASGGEVPNRIRSTMRISLGGRGNMIDSSNSTTTITNTQPTQGPQSDDILYLQTTTRHLDDVTISGPYHSSKSLLRQVMDRLAHENSFAGQRTLQELLDATGGRLPVHFTAPLPNGQTLRFDFLHETNAEVAQTLPAPAFTLMMQTPLTNARGHPVMAQLPGGGGFMKLRDAEVVKTFTSAEPALAEAKRKMAELKVGGGARARSTDLGAQGEEMLFCGAVLGLAGQTPVRLVVVRRDDGVTVPGRGFDD